MKINLVLMILFVSRLAMAVDLTGDLNLTNLFAGTNAGEYKIEVDVNLKDQAIATSTHKIVNNPNQDDPNLHLASVCMTEIIIDAGTVTLRLIDKKTGRVRELKETLQFYTSDFSSNQQCPDSKFILAPQTRFSAYVTMNQSIYLNYTAPKAFDSLESKFTVFPYGYSVSLNATMLNQNQFLISNLQKQLSSQLKYNNSNGLSYYIFAINNSISTELGQGFIELK